MYKARRDSCFSLLFSGLYPPVSGCVPDPLVYADFMVFPLRKGLDLAAAFSDTLKGLESDLPVNSHTVGRFILSTLIGT